MTSGPEFPQSNGLAEMTHLNRENDDVEIRIAVSVTKDIISKYCI